MGGLNSGPGPGITLLIAFVLILCSNVLSAPLYEEDDTQVSNAQGVIEPQGCYYNFQHYNEGERILTNEPCLNCTCRNRMLMCYLRVCPFTKGIGQNCTVEKVPGQCCPIITCPEVPVQLLTSSTTEHSEDDGRRPEVHHGIKGTAVGHLDDNGCQIDGVFYPNGAQVPGNPEKPCELCYCIRNKTACIMQACALHVDGCRPIYEDGQCFPVRYQCDDQPYEEEPTTTIRPAPTPGLIITTTSSEPLECFYNNEIYEDGSRIQTEDPCEHCYCLKGKIACAVQECGAPLEKEGQNCTALPPAPGKCCPDSYQCDITMSSQKFGQGSEGTTEAGFSSVADAGHPTDGHYPGEHGATKTTEKPKYGTNQQSGDVTEGLTPEAVTPSKGVSGKPSVISDGQGPHMVDKGQPGSPDSSDLEHHEELDKGTQLPTKHHDSLPNEYEGTPDVSNVPGKQKITSTDETKPGVTKRPVYGTKPEIMLPNSGFPTIPGSLNELVQRHNQSQTDPMSSIHHTGHKEKPQNQKPEQYGDEKEPVSGSKPQEPSSVDATKVQDGIQTTQGSGHPTTESEHILHVMEQQKPAPGIESHIQDTSSTKRPYDEGLSTLNADSTEKTGSTKPSYGGHWKPQPGIYQPDLQGTPFDASHGQTSPDRTKPVFPGSDRLPEDNYGYSTPIPAIDEDQNVKGQMTVSNAKDQLIDKLHNIIQDVQAQVNDGKTTEMPEEADYKTTTQSQKGHFTEKPDTIPHLHHGSQESHHPLGSGHNVPTTKPTSDKETQPGNVVTDTPKDTSDIFNKIQGIIHGMFTQVTEAVQTTLAPLTSGDVDGKIPSKVDEESSSASPEHKPDTTHELKPSDGSSKHPPGTKPADSYEHSNKEGLAGAPDNSNKRPQGSGSHYPQGSTKYPGYTESTTRKHGSTQTRYPDGSKPEDSEYPSVTQYPDYISPDSETGDYGKYPEGSRPEDTSYGSTKYPEGSKPTHSGKYPHGTEHQDDKTTDAHQNKYPEGFKPSASKPHDDEKYSHGTKPTASDNYPFGTEYPDGVGVTGRPQDHSKYPSGSEKYPYYPHGTEYPDEVGSTVTPDELGKYPDGTSPVKGSGVKYPGQTGSTGKPHYSTKYPGSKYPEGFTGKPTGSEDEPYGTEYPEDVGSTGRPQVHGKYPEGTKPSGSHKYPHYPHGTEYPDEIGSTVTPDEYGKYPDGTSPIKTPEGVKYPGQTGSTGRPQYSTKYPGSKYPEGVTGKPTGSEDQHYGTEYPEEDGVTGRPQDAGEYPEGTKPSGSQKYPHYPHGTEYPDEVGSTITPDEFGKYPDGSSPVKGSEGAKYPGQTGSTGKPHYSTKYPGSKYPEGVTGKPSGSEDQPYGTEYPEDVGSTGRPQVHGKYPEGTKPSGTHKYPHYPHGTEYPDEIGSTGTPDELGKYPDGISPVKGSGGLKHPSDIGSTGRPNYSTKYPEGVSGKPSDVDNKPYGTENPEGVGVTGRPQGTEKYPEGAKPTHSDADHPYGTEYPEGETATDRPYDSSKYPEGTKPVRGPGDVVYPGQTESDSRPQVGDQYLEGTRPPQSQKHPLATEYPDKEFGTDRPYGANKYPTGFRPNEKYPGGSQHTGTEAPEYSTMYPNEYDTNVTPDVSGKYPHGSKPTGGIYRPDGTKYPDHTDTTGRPQYPGKYPEGFDPAQKPQGSTQHFGRPTGKPFGTEEYPYGTDHPEGQILTGKPHDTEFGSTSRPDDSSKYPYQTEYPEGFTGKPDDLSGLPDGYRPIRPGYRPQDSKYPTGSPFDSTRFPVGSRPTFRPIESGKYPESSTQISDQENLFGTQSPYEGDVTSKPQTTGKYPSDVSRYPDGSKPTYSGKYPETGDSKKPHDSQTDRPEGSRPSGSPQVTSKYPEGLTDKPYDLTKYPQESKPSDKYPFGTEYPEGVGSTVQPNELGKYPDETSPVKGTEGIKHPDQTGSTERPQYPAKYPGSKYPEGITGKPSDTENQPYGTEYPEGAEVTGRPQGAEKYPEGVKPTESDSERPYGTEYPEGETGTDRPHDSSKYPDRTKPEGVSYQGQTGSTGRPHYSTKYPGSKFSEGVTDTEQEPHATKYPEDVGGTGRPEYSEKYPEKVKPVGKPDEIGKYPDGAKPSDKNQLPGGEEPENQPGGEESETDRPYQTSKHPVGYRPNDKYPEGLKPTDSQESTKVPDDPNRHPDDGASSESVTDHQVGSTDKESTDRPDLIKHPEGYKPTGDTQEHPDDSKPTDKNEPKPDPNTPSGQKKHGEPDEEGLKPEQSETSPDDTESLNKQGTTGKPDDSSHYPGGAQPTSSDKYPFSTKYPDEAGSTTKPDEFEKHSEHYRPDGKPEDTGKFPEGIKQEDLEKYPHGSEHPTAEEEINGPQDLSKYPEGTKPVRGQEGVKYPAQTESSDKPNYSTKYPVHKYPEGVTGKPTGSEDQSYGTEYPEEDGLTGRPHDHSKYPEESKPTSQKYPHYPHGTEYPEEIGITGRPHDQSKYPEGSKPTGSEKYPHGTEYPYEVGSTITPDEFGKYPDGSSPVKGSEGAKYPGQTGSTGKPHYSTKYPGSKYPERVTGKPTGSEDEPYITEYPEDVGSTGKPQVHGKYPEGTKPSGTHKYPHYPHGTEYPDEIGSTVTPDELGKYPDETSPVKGPEGVKLPDEFPSTGKPHYSTKYPGVTGKPVGSENQPYGTENPEGSAVTGQPQDQNKYPLGTKPSGSQKHPHYPHGTEYPDEKGSTATPDEFAKYPDGSRPVTGSEGVKYPGQTGSTSRPQYPTKYPGSKYPEGITGKPTGSEDPSYGTEYSEGLGVTDRPQDHSKYPEGAKPSGSDKYPHYPHGTEYPEGIGSTVIPDEFGKYPEGTSPVKGSEGVKHPIETESTGRPHYSTKYPGDKYPEEVSGKPSGADDKPYGTEYPEGVGVTGTPQGAVKYPEGAKPTHSESDRPYGTDYPEGETGTDKPYHSSKYPEGSKPVQEPDGVKYPGQTGSTGQPFYSTQYPDGQKPTYRPEDTNKLSEGVKPTDENYSTNQPHGSRPNDKYPVESHTGSDHEIHTTEFPEDITGTSKPHDLSKYPEGLHPSISGHKPEEGKYPESSKVGGKPKDPSKHPEGTQPEDAGHYPHGTEYPDQVGSTGKPYDPSERPDSFDATGKYPEKSTPLSHVTKHPNEETGTVEPFDFTKHPDGSKPLHSTKYPEEYKPTGQPQYVGEGTGGTKYPEYIGSTLLPHVTSKYPGDRETIGKPEDSNKLPEEITPTEKKPGAENDQSSNEYPNEILGTDKPYNAAEHPEGFKPHYTTKHPGGKIPSDLESMSHSTKYPHEPAGKPDEFVKHPDGKDPVHEPGVTYPDQFGSPESPHYSTKYPGSHRPTGKPQNLLPEGFTGTPIDSEDQPHGTEPTDEVELTGKPQNLGQYPEGSKQTSQKHPQYPHGTEYPDEVGSTLTPEELGKNPDGTSPVKGSEGVKHPSETASTGKPHYSTKYPGSKYPEGFTGKPTGLEDKPYGTEYPEDVDSTGRPQDHGKYPEGTKPSGPHKYPHYPHGTEYPDEIGSTVTPDEYGKYPDGTSPIKTPEGVKYPGQTGSTSRPQYSTKYPGSKYPEGVTGKPIGSEDQHYGTEYPEGVGVTGRPQDAGKYPDGTKPSDFEKYPHYPQGTEYPDEIGSTVTPDEYGKYPDGTSPVKGPEGVKYPGQTGSTSRPHYSTKYPGSKHPDGFTGKPSDSEDQLLGTEYPEGFGVTDVPLGSSNKRKPTFPGESLYGTEYPGEETETDKPYHSSKYPEGTKPVSGPEGVNYPDQTSSTGRPQYADTDKHPDYNRVTDIPFDSNKFPGGTKPEDSVEHGPSSKRPDGTLGTTKSHDSSKYPEGVQPSTSGYDVNEGKYPGFTKVTEKPFDSTKYPEGGKPSHPQHTESGEDTDRPHEKDKHPDGLEPGVTEKHPDVSKYPSGTEDTDELGSTIKPESDGKLPVGFKPTDSDRPSGDTHFSHPEGVTDSDDYAIITEHPGVELTGTPDDSNKFPEGFKPTGRPQYTGKYPEGIKPTDSEFSSSATEYPESSKYPDEFKPSSTPHDSSKYPEGVTPSLLEKHPEDIGGSRITVRPDGVTEYPGEYTGKPHNTNKYPHETGSISSGDTPYGTEYPEEAGSSKYPDKFRPTGRPHGSTRYPEGSKPSVTDLHSTVYPYVEGSTDKPNDLGKYPEKVKPTDFEKYPFSTKYPGEIQSTNKPDAFGKYPEETRPGTKPHDSEKYPESEEPTYSDKYPHGTEYPYEVGSTVTPDEFGKYPEGSSPVTGSEGVKYPGHTGSTSRPHYSTKYPGSKYPEGFTGKPTGSEDEPYGTEYPEDVGSTGRPQDHGKYPEGTKPSGPHKYPHYPHGTEYPDEIGSTVTPDEYGKYPDGTSPIKTPEGVKYPGQTGYTGRPQYSTKYPGSKYPEGVTGKPIGSEDQHYGTEYPEGVGVTGRPQDAGEYPEGTKPSGSQKYPHYPHGTEYPDEIGSTVTPDEYGKYPDGTSPVKGSEGVKYPGQTGSTSRPHYSTKYPGSKYPEGFTGKPTGSEDQPYGTEYPEGLGVTGRPHNQSKYPQGTKPTDSQKYPHGTEYPDEIGSTVTPEEFGKYPDGISPVTGSGVKHPSDIGSTVKPHYSTKYPESKYPEGISGKPTGSEDQSYGTEHSEGLGVTDRPQDHNKYPLGVTTNEFGKYPDGINPVKGSEEVKYPGQAGSTDRPEYSTKYPESKYPEGITGKPTGSEDQPYGTEYPEDVGSTGRPQVHGKYPEGTKPTSQKHPHYPHGTEYPDEIGTTVTPDEFGKYPDGISPVTGSEGVKYPGQTGSTGRPQDHGQYPEGSKPSGPHKYPHYPHGPEYPDEFGSTVTPDEFGKYPEGTSPVKGSEGVKHPIDTESTDRPNYSTKYPGSKYPEGVTGKPTGPDDQSYGAEYPEGVGVTGTPQGAVKYPEGAKPTHSDSDLPYSTEYPEGETGTDRPYNLNKYPEGTKPVRGPDGIYPSQTGSTGKPQGVGEYPEEGKPIPEDKYPDGIKPTTPKDSSYGTQYPERLGGSTSDTSSSTPDSSVYDSVSKQPGSMYLPQFPQTNKPFSPNDDKDKPLELPEESYSVKPGHDSYGSSTPKGPESIGLTDKPGVPVPDQSIDEMDVTTHSPDEYPKRPDSADLTHDPEYRPQSGEHSSKHPSKTSSTQGPDTNLNEQYPATNEPSTDQDGKVAPQGVKAPQDDLLPTRPGSESPHTEKTLSAVSTPKHGSSETERPVQGLSGHDQSTTDKYGSPIKHPDDKQGSTSPGSVNKYSESSDEYSTTEYSTQDGITGKPSGTHTKRPVEQPSRPGQGDVYTTQQPSEGRPTHGVGHPEGVSPGSEGFDGNVYETTTLNNDDLINKLQSIISGIQTQVTNDKTTRQPSTSDLNAPFGQTTEIPHEGEQKPQDHSKQPHESVEYATEKPYVTGDKRRPIDGFDSTKPHATEKPLAGPVDELTTGLEEEATEGYLEEENEVHDPEGHFSKKPSSGSSTEYPETGRPSGTKRPGEETVGSHGTKHPEGYTDQPAGKPHDTSVQTQDENKPTSSTDRYPEEGMRPDKVPASGEKVTGKPDDSIHFPDEKPGSPTSESSTPGVSDEQTPTRKTGSTQVGSDDVSSTIGYDSEKPEDFDSSTKKPGTHHDTRPAISQTETEDHVHETSSTPKDGVLGVTKTPETDSKPQKGVTKPGDRPGVHQSSKPDDETHPHGEENVPIYHGVESMAGKPTDRPDSMIGEDHTVLPEEDTAGTKKPLKSTEKPSHGVPLDEEIGQVTENEKHPSHEEPTEKPLHVVYPTYYPDGIITRKPGSRPQDLGNKVTVTPQSNVYGTSTPSKEDDDATQSVGDREVMKPTSKVPTDGSSLSSGEPVTEGLDTEGSTKRVVPQEGFTTGDLAGKPHAPVDKHPDSSLDDIQGSGESSTTSPVIIIEEVHTEVHSERATTKPGTESYDQTTKSVYPHGSDENLTEKPETFDRKTTKKPDLFSPGTDSVFQEGKPGYESTVHPLSTDRPQDSLYHASQPSHGSSVPVHGITESYPDVLVGSTTDESLYQGTGKPVYQTKHPESPDGKSTNEPGLVTDGTTPSADHSGQPGSQHIMNLYSPKDKYSTTIGPEIVKGTQQPGSFTTGSRVPGVTEEGSLYTTSKPDDSHQGPTFDHEIFGSKFPGRKTTQKPLVAPEAQPDFTTVFEVGTTREPQEGVTSTPTQGINVEHHIPSFIFPQKQPEHGATEGYITQGKPLTTVGQPGVIFEGKQTTPSYQFITSGTHDPEISTKKPFQPSVKGASYVPYRIIDGRKVYYPEREVSQKPDEDDKHGFDGFDYLPYEIINGKKFFKPNEVVSQPVQTSTTPKHRLGMYVPYKIINGTKVYYTEDPQGKPHAGVEDYDGLDYVPFDIINGTKVFYPEAVNEPTSPTFQETTTRPSYIMAMYVPYKIINGTKVYYPEDSPNKPESEDYDGLDYVPYEIVNGKKVFYPERVTTPPKGTSTPSYVMAMYVPYKIINGTKVYYPEDPQGKPQSEDYDGLDYVPFEMVNGTKVFYPERVTATPEATTKPAHTMAMYVPYKIVNGTKVYYPEEPQVDSEGFDGLDYVPFEIVNGTKVFYPERVSTTSYEGTTTPSYPSAMYVPYKIVDGRKVYYPKYAQYKPYKVPEGFVGFDYIPYEIVNGSKVFYPDRATTVRPTVPPTKHHQGMYVPYKIVNGTKIYYPKDAEEKPQGVLDGYDGSDYVPYEIVNGTQVFYPEKATTEKPGIKAMYVPYKIVDGTKVYYAKDAQPTPNLIPKGYDGFDFVPYEIVNGTKTFYPERVTTPTPAPNELYYTQGMYVPYKIVDGRKVYYPQRAQHNPLEIPEGFEGFDYILYDIVNGTKVFHPERVTGSPAPTHAPSGTFYPQGMYVPFRVINGTKVFYPQDAQHRPDPMKNDYDGWQHLPYDIVNGTKVFYPERVTTEPPADTMSAMYVPFKMINGTKVFYVNDAQYQPYLIPEGYDGFEYVPYEIVNGTKKFYPSSHYPTTAKPFKQGMFVPYKIINGAKVYYPKHASDSPRPPSSEYSGVDFIPYEVINGTKVFYPDRIQGPELETSGTQAMYVPYKMVNGTKVFYPKDAQFKPYLIPEGYDGFDYLPYEMKNGTKVFYPERLTVTQRPEQVPSQGMFVPYKMINGQKVYYPKEAQKRPHPLSNEYDGLDYVPYEVVNGTKVFYPEYVTQSADMSGTPMSQAMYVPYKIINGTKVFYPKYAQHKPHLVPDGYDGFEYVPYKIVNGTKFFYPDRVATKPQKLQGMYVPYKIINGTKVFYPKYAQPTLQQLPKGFDGIDYIPYEVVNGTKVFYPEKATPSGVSGTPVVQALYVPYKIINGKKVFYPKYAVERPQTIPEGYDGFAYMPYSIVNGTKMFYPEQAQFPGVNKVPSLQGTFVPYKLLNSTKVFYPKYANDESPRVPDGYDGVDYVPYEPVNGTKVFYPELISPQASSGTSPVPGKYVPYKIVNGKKVFYPKEGKPQYPSGGVRYPYDGIVYVPYKSLSGTSPSRPENYPPFVTPEHSLYGQNSEIVYVDDDDESFRPQFISQSRPSQEQTGGHIGHVPGEGSCFLNNKTYENNMEIPPVSPCQSRCRCINSIVRCVRIKCPPLPQSNTANCSPVYDEGSCCPTYSCENDDLDYLTTTEYPEMVLTGSSSTVISFGQGFDSTTQFAVTDASPHKSQYGQDGAGDFSGEKPHPSRKPVTSDGQHPTDQYHIHRPQKPKPSEQGSLEPYDGVEGHPMPGEFSSEDDYDGEDEEPYGPGTCRYAGKVYVSAQQIPRDDPCDFCFCFRSDIICLQQSCPPPIPGCRDEPIQGFCCPRYECHVKMATLLNVTSTTTTTTTTLPPHFFLHPYKGSATRTGCFVQGKAYRVGQAIPSASGPCMDCICRGNGRMECEPKVCTPEPMIRKMIVPAENTTSPSSER